MMSWILVVPAAREGFTPGEPSSVTPGVFASPGLEIMGLIGAPPMGTALGIPAEGGAVLVVALPKKFILLFCNYTAWFAG